MPNSKLEVLVEFGSKIDENEVNKTIKTLKIHEEVKDVHFKNGSFMVETTLPTSKVLDIVSKTTGRRTVLQGFGESQSAVAMVSSHSPSHQILGVVRFQQTSDGSLIADGTIDGLTKGPHGLHVHECGDISEGCKSIGDHFNPLSTPHGGPNDPSYQRHKGDLGNIVADDTGRATFRIVDNVLQVWDLIGRSVAVSEKPDDLGRGNNPESKINGNSGEPVACGIIARSSHVFGNPKRICLCDGVVVWEEREKQLAGGNM